jgi:hypothetical protein
VRFRRFRRPSGLGERLKFRFSRAGACGQTSHAGVVGPSVPLLLNTSRLVHSGTGTPKNSDKCQDKYIGEKNNRQERRDLSGRKGCRCRACCSSGKRGPARAIRARIGIAVSAGFSAFPPDERRIFPRHARAASTACRSRRIIENQQVIVTTHYQAK